MRGSAGRPGERDAERDVGRADGAGDGYYTGRFTASTGGRLELSATATAGTETDTHTVVGSATQVVPIVAGGHPSR